MQSGSAPGSLHRQVGRKNGNAWSVLSAAWHFVTVTVLHATVSREKKKTETWVVYKDRIACRQSVKRERWKSSLCSNLIQSFVHAVVIPRAHQRFWNGVRIAIIGNAITMKEAHLTKKRNNREALVSLKSGSGFYKQYVATSFN